MAKDILTFGVIEIEKYKFYCHKTPMFLRDVDIKKEFDSEPFYKKNL